MPNDMQHMQVAGWCQVPHSFEFWLANEQAYIYLSYVFVLFWFDL